VFLKRKKLIKAVSTAYLVWTDLSGVACSVAMWNSRNDCLQGRWTGRGEATVWPPRSPPLTPLYFFFGGGGYVKTVYYTPPPPTPMLQSLDEPKIRIQDACKSADMQLLSIVLNYNDYHIHVFRINNGANTEIR
jgi:hypothetical protein